MLTIYRLLLILLIGIFELLRRWFQFYATVSPVVLHKKYMLFQLLDNPGARYARYRGDDMKESVITGEADTLLDLDMAKEQSGGVKRNYMAKIGY